MIPESPIPFETFMRRALHDPEHGYYARRIARIGSRGDFTTAAMLSPDLARAIARWAVAAMRETGCRDLIEIGPGEGRLAADVLAALPWTTRLRTRLHLVETSAPLKARQQQRLGRRAVWHATARDAIDACRGRAVLYSNELVDAFPVRLFEKTSAGWHEVHVSRTGRDSFRESLHPAALPDSSSFEFPHSAGQRVEVHESYHAYLVDWLPHWRAGRMITIDYGAPAATLFHRRPRGTLRGYLHQQRLEGHDLYRNPGRQDLTADVNFTDLARWSAPWAASHAAAPMAEFLNRWNPTADPALADPEGAGGAFLVLEQEPAPGNEKAADPARSTA